VLEVFLTTCSISPDVQHPIDLVCVEGFRVVELVNRSPMPADVQFKLLPIQSGIEKEKEAPASFSFVFNPVTDIRG